MLEAVGYGQNWVAITRPKHTYSDRLNCPESGCFRPTTKLVRRRQNCLFCTRKPTPDTPASEVGPERYPVSTLILVVWILSHCCRRRKAVDLSSLALRTCTVLTFSHSETHTRPVQRDSSSLRATLRHQGSTATSAPAERRAEAHQLPRASNIATAAFSQAKFTLQTGKSASRAMPPCST
jgi:hypothetical protein